MIKSFSISPHKYHIYESGTDELYIKICRKLRTDPLPDMIQPIIKGGIMGYDTIIEIKHNGKPLYNANIQLYKDMRLIDDNRTNTKGNCLLRLPYYEECNCTPFDKCNTWLRDYLIQIEYDEEASPLTRVTQEMVRFNAILGNIN